MTAPSWRTDPAVAEALEALWEELPGYVGKGADAALDRLCDAVAKASAGDTERLDWIETHDATVLRVSNIHGSHWAIEVDRVNALGGTCSPTLRGAIDYAKEPTP